jgi:hypothetical protein
MTAEIILLEQRPDPNRDGEPEPTPLYSVAERLALWSHQFGLPATDREWIDALEGGLIHPPQRQAANES